MIRLIAILLIGGIPTIIASADDPVDAPASPVAPLMRMKLESAKAILEGLTTEDFGQIAQNARSLKLFSLETGWNVIQTPMYTTQSDDFRRAADMVVEAANDRDISRAALGYVAVTVRCVECHAYIRKHRSQLSAKQLQ